MPPFQRACFVSERRNRKITKLRFDYMLNYAGVVVPGALRELTKVIACLIALKKRKQLALGAFIF